jgi:very-short-patch-repair endonuclease
MTQRNRKDELSDKEYLTHLLFETDKSLADIARTLEISLNDLNSTLKKLGLSWIKDHRRKMSKGQTILTSIVKKLLPGEKVINEHHIGDRLKLDVYCPKYKLGLEFHGIQHFKYSPLFFESKDAFLEAQKRDDKKIALCKEQGIALVVFRYNDNISEDVVYDRILFAIRQNPVSDDQQKKFKKPSIKDNPSYQKAKKIRSENSKKYYKQLKERRKNVRRDPD